MTRRVRLIQSPDILDAIRDPHLFGPWFKWSKTWTAWFAFLAALFALPMTPEQFAIYRQCTGRACPPSSVAPESWLICGRRAGKSFVLALVAVFLACFYDYRPHLAPGERGTVLVIATDRKQARVIDDPADTFLGFEVADIDIVRFERRVSEAPPVQQRIARATGRRPTEVARQA